MQSQAFASSALCRNLYVADHEIREPNKLAVDPLHNLSSLLGVLQ
jgi:hypothetical protein